MPCRWAQRRKTHASDGSDAKRDAALRSAPPSEARGEVALDPLSSPELHGPPQAAHAPTYRVLFLRSVRGVLAAFSPVGSPLSRSRPAARRLCASYPHELR